MDHAFDRTAVAAYAGLTPLAFVWAGIAGRLPFGPEFPPSPDQLPRWIAAGLLGGLIVVVGTHLASHHLQIGQDFEQMVRAIVGEVTWKRAFILALASSIGEELFFRGALQPTIGLVPATILFALAHFPAKRELIPWTVFAGVVGLGLGFLFERSGSVVAPVIAHFVVNFINLRAIGKLPPSDFDFEDL